MNIAIKPLAEIRPHAGNPRQNDDAVAAVAASLKEFGFRKPIVVDREGVIVCGHTCFAAAQSLGLEAAPVHVAEDLTDEQIRAYRTADNKTGELADWDYNLLTIELNDLAGAFDMTDFGFDPAALSAIMEGVAAPPVSVAGGKSTSLDKLRWGSQSVPLSAEEAAALDRLLEQHIAAVGVPFGFAAWLASHVPS